MFRDQGAANRIAVRQDVGCQRNECVDPRFWSSARPRAGGRREFESAHAARSDIAEPLDGIEALGCASLRSEPGVDERVAELVGQRVCEQSRKAVEGNS